MFNELKSALSLKTYEKNIFKENETNFEDLAKSDVIELNIIYISRIYEYVKMVLKDYEEALKDLNKVDVLQPNNAFILRSCGYLSKIC
jgi:tetratricopeptide (TPR) repeat protein